ncbi:MAG: hypothetical protein AB1896_11150 [Thermodesulfobacteriota bacterium]
MTLVREWIYKGRWPVLAVLAVLGVLVVLLESRAGAELAAARQALAGGDPHRALTHYSRSLNWYVPFGAADTAAEELLGLGLNWARDGKNDLASLALMRLRAGLYGARWIYTPRRDLLGRAEPALARLMALARLGPGAAPGQIEEKASGYLDLMRRPATPRPGPALAAAGGFLLWTAAVLAFIFVYFGPEGPKRKKAWLWAIAWAAGFALWLGGLTWA